MADSKINFKIGAIEFSSEGDSSWVGSQLDKILKQIPDLLKIAPKEVSHSNPGSHEEHKPHIAVGVKGKTLAGFLREHVKTPNGVRTFLATAAFLQSGGKEKLITADITKALSDAKQSKLGNASDSLNQNIGKGHCEKDGKSFFVTTEGFKQLGLQE